MTLRSLFLSALLLLPLRAAEPFVAKPCLRLGEASAAAGGLPTEFKIMLKLIYL